MWLKLSDGFARNPKVQPLSDGAFRLHVTAMLHCAEHLTDGFLDARLEPLRTADPALVAEVVGEGLWLEAAGGWTIHDFLEWNPPADEVKEKRRKEAERKAAQRAKSDRGKDGRYVSQRDNPRDNPRDDRGESRRTRPVPSLNTPPTPQGLHWEGFRVVYPCKDHLDDVTAAMWTKALEDAGDWRPIIDGAKAYAAFVVRNATTAQFIRHPKNWLKDREWTKDYSPPIDEHQAHLDYMNGGR